MKDIDIRTNFSPDEMDLIEEHRDQHNGHLKEKGGFIRMKSELVNSSFKLTKNKDGRIVKAVVRTFDSYSEYDCVSPHFLKRNLGL